MELTEKYTGITEATNDWEAGDAPTPVARFDYSRVSSEAPADDQLADEANSDLGNLGRDVEDLGAASVTPGR
ncbi:MAG TPA: hypothetical protein VKY74_08350 [Chloroflexia bacterium]|nr:hypothetical protein [Chloroflexia bacterium]